MSLLNLDGKRFLVMGVANRKSVAWAITKSLEAEGAEVIHSVRSESRLESLEKLLDGRKAYVCDVEFPEQIEALAEAVAADYDGLDGIVHSIAFANYSRVSNPSTRLCGRTSSKRPPFRPSHWSRCPMLSSLSFAREPLWFPSGFHRPM